MRRRVLCVTFNSVRVLKTLLIVAALIIAALGGIVIVAVAAAAFLIGMLIRRLVRGSAKSAPDLRSSASRRTARGGGHDDVIDVTAVETSTSEVTPSAPELPERR